MMLRMRIRPKHGCFRARIAEKKGGRPAIRLLLSMSPIACCAQTASICQAVRTLHLAACRSSAHPFSIHFAAQAPRVHARISRSTVCVLRSALSHLLAPRAHACARVSNSFLTRENGSYRRRRRGENAIHFLHCFVCVRLGKGPCLLRGADGTALGHTTGKLVVHHGSSRYRTCTKHRACRPGRLGQDLVR